MYEHLIFKPYEKRHGSKSTLFPDAGNNLESWETKKSGLSKLSAGGSAEKASTRPFSGHHGDLRSNS